MRITQIRSWKQLGEFSLDQVGHAAIVLLSVSWFASGPSDVAIAGAVILTIREGEQGRETVASWIKARRPYFDGETWLHYPSRPGAIKLLIDLRLPDRFGDIMLGSCCAVGLFLGYGLVL